LLSSLTLERMHDAELKVPADQDAMTTAELISSLTNSIYSEVGALKPGEYTNRKPAISSLRRDLQRRYLKRMASIAMGQSFAPDDCRSVASSELAALEGRVKATLAQPDLKLDAYSRAHLEDTAATIRKVLEARLNLLTP
jgi:hypothetical protein